MTERIKTDLTNVCILLLQASQKRAWSSLGYRTWERYVRCEFGLSRSRSYELLDQGRVILEIKDASGMSGIPDISPYAASQIKPNLSVVVHAIRERLASDPKVEAEVVVTEVIRDERARIASTSLNGRSSRALSPNGADPLARSTFLRVDKPDQSNSAGAQVGIRKLVLVVDYLADMPAVANLIGQLSDDDIASLGRLPKATQWLNDFARHFQGSIAAHERSRRFLKAQDAPSGSTPDVERPLGRRVAANSSGFQPSAD